MKNKQYTNCDELFADPEAGIAEGDEVRVNGEHTFRVRLDEHNNFCLEGWSKDDLIDVLEVIRPLPINIDDIHPTIKE